MIRHVTIAVAVDTLLRIVGSGQYATLLQLMLVRALMVQVPLKFQQLVV